MALTQITTDGIKDGTITGTDLATNIDLVDNQKLRLGTGNDLQIYHNGSDTYFEAASTAGQIIHSANEWRLQNLARNENMILANQDGLVRLFYNGTTRFETTSAGATVTGALTTTGNINVPSANGIVTGSVTTTGATALTAVDNGTAYFGTGLDLRIFHNGSSSVIRDDGSGALTIQNANGEANLYNTTDNEYLARFTNGGSVDLYYDGSKKFETTSSGNKATGKLGIDDGNGSSGNYISLGNSDDFKIFHDGSESYVKNANASSNLILESAHGVHIKHGGENMARFVQDGAVELYHDNTLKIKTQSFGADIYGLVQISGNCIPDTNNSYDLGTSSARWRNVYTNDLNLSNEGSSNDVDGTWGSYTIQEGAEDLFLVNKRSGKKYKFNLTEVN